MTINTDLSSKYKIISFLFDRLMHDFSNKLTLIMGHTNILEENLIENGIVDNNLGKIINAVNEAVYMMKEIILFKNILENTNISELSNEDMIQIWLDYKNRMIKK